MRQAIIAHTVCLDGMLITEPLTLVNLPLNWQIPIMAQKFGRTIKVADYIPKSI